MITKLDKVVVAYLRVLDSKPNPRSDAAVYDYLERAERARFAVLDLLIRKPRYSGLTCRRAWKSKENPHRPPGL